MQFQSTLKQEITRNNRAGLAQTLDRAAAVASAELGQLRALPPPSGNHSLADSYFAGVASQISLLQQLAGAVQRNDSAAESSLSRQLNQEGPKIRALARQYGFKACGSGTTSP